MISLGAAVRRLQGLRERQQAAHLDVVQKTITGVQNRYTRGMKPQTGIPSLVSPVIDLNSGTTSGSCA